MSDKQFDQTRPTMNDVLRRMLASSPEPHKPPKAKRKPKPKPKPKTPKKKPA